MRIILVRHGNTFASGDVVFWVGARTDIPLVAEGRQQAREIGKVLRNSDIVPDCILTGPLRRTEETAELLAEVGGYEIDLIKVERDLIEIDYGHWEGRTSKEIRETFGVTELEKWDLAGEWPINAGWRPSEAEFNFRIKSMVTRLTDQLQSTRVAILVSSNGVFRAIGRLAGLTGNSAKMRTGSISSLVIAHQGIDVNFWNKLPSEIESEQLQNY